MALEDGKCLIAPEQLREGQGFRSRILLRRVHHLKLDSRIGRRRAPDPPPGGYKFHCASDSRAPLNHQHCGIKH